MLQVGRDRIAVDQVLAVARGELAVALDPDPGFRARLRRAREAVLERADAAAVVTIRLLALARGHSGVRAVVLERLCELLNARLLPAIPEEGSLPLGPDLPA